MIEFEVSQAQGRLDSYLAHLLPELSRSAIQRLISGGQVTVNGELTRANYKPRAGDLVAVARQPDESLELHPEALQLAIIYEDDVLLVVDKPAGMVVHPAPGHHTGTLAHALLAHCPELLGGKTDRPGIIHRLDRDTSGLVLVAKTEKARKALQQQFKDRTVGKAYCALLEGHLQPAWGRIEAPVSRDPRHRQRMAVLPGGREAITEYHVLELFSHRLGPRAGDYTLVSVEPRTGRTHQIRVHFASIGHPVVGDTVYGPRKPRLSMPRQFLHAQKLSIRHPATRRTMDFAAPLPRDLASVLELLRGP